MSDKVFLSTLARGLARGVYTAGGQGVVETVLERTVVTCLARTPGVSAYPADAGARQVKILGEEVAG